MTPQLFLEKHQTILAHHQKAVEKAHIYCIKSIAVLISLLTTALGYNIVYHQNLNHHAPFIFILSGLLVLIMVLDAFEWIHFILCWRHRDILRVKKLIQTHKLTVVELSQNQKVWVFYKPSRKTTYSVYDTNFNCLRHNFRLTKGYHVLVNLELDEYDPTGNASAPYIDEFLSLFQLNRHVNA